MHADAAGHLASATWFDLTPSSSSTAPDHVLACILP